MMRLALSCSIKLFTKSPLSLLQCHVYHFPHSPLQFQKRKQRESHKSQTHTVLCVCVCLCDRLEFRNRGPPSSLHPPFFFFFFIVIIHNHQSYSNAFTPQEKTIKKEKHSTADIHRSIPTIQIKVQESFVEKSVVKFHCEKESSDCETASVAFLDHSCLLYLVVEEELSAVHHQMADSSNGNGKLEETHKVEEGEAVRDIAIDDYSLEHAKKGHEEPKEAAEETPAEVVEEKEEEVVPVSVVEAETYVVDDVLEPEVKEEKEEKEYAPSVDETVGPSTVVEDVVTEEIEEKALSDLVSNGLEVSTLPSLSEDITNVVSKGIEETEVPCSDEKEEEEVVPPFANVVSKGIEEVKVPVVEEISTGESSGAHYKVTSESVDDDSLKPSPEVPVPPPVDAGEGYGERDISETTEKPTIVSVTRAPLQPTSWRSCCGLFEVLRRSDR